jgi:hypothetical protein
MSDYELKRLAEDLKRTWEGELKPRIESGERQDRRGQAGSQPRPGPPRRARGQDAEGLTVAGPYDRGQRVKSRTWTKQYVDFLRKGQIDDDAHELKALAMRDESLGGVLAPADFIAEVIKGVVQYSPIRSGREGPADQPHVACRRPSAPATSPRSGPARPARARRRPATWGSRRSRRTSSTRASSSPTGTSRTPRSTSRPTSRTRWPSSSASPRAPRLSGDGNGKPEGILTNADVEQVSTAARRSRTPTA